MADLIPWLGLILWCLAIALRVHPRTRAWAPRGAVGAGALTLADAARGSPAPAPAGGADVPAAVPVPRDRGRSLVGAL